jgi:hypothetical protein
VVIPAHHLRFYVPVMSEKGTSAGSWNEAGLYEIRLKGHLDTRWAARFDGLSLTHESDGITVVHGPIVDQAALHGLLQKVRDLGLPLVSVIRVEPDQPSSSPDSHSQGAQL